MQPKAGASRMSGSEDQETHLDPGTVGVPIQEVMRLAELLAVTTSEMGELIRKMERCIDSAVTLVKSEADPRTEGIIRDLRTAALSIQAVAKQIEQVSGATVVVSSRSLAQMGVDLQKAVARIEVAWTGSDDADPPVEAPPAS